MHFSFTVKFRGELDHEKLSLKCYHGIPCPGTKKWTGGIEGLQLYKGVKKETPSGKIYECVEEKSWFAMIIRNWTDADIFSQYKCWNKFKEYSVILNEQPILYKTGDDDPIKCNDENKEMTMLTMNVTVLHTSQQPSFTYDTEIENFTQNLMVSQRPEKMGPWFITDIYAEIIRENNVNKTFYLKYKDNKTFTIIEEFVHCNGSKGTWPDFKDKSSMVVVVSSVCVVIIALAVLLGCCRKKISEFCSRQGRGRSYTDTSTSNSDLANQTVLEPFIMN
ncbi:unnamed protein product [Mytilus coruscus]|uniref:Uncharacterized protein n=1 Tax=Mytilus coruscus TaxID=42192 RepID=A0A6J8DVZ0_MYTCO|nr:unnamed protein product [Mytilus coruscus]